MPGIVGAVNFRSAASQRQVVEQMAGMIADYSPPHSSAIRECGGCALAHTVLAAGMRRPHVAASEDGSILVAVDDLIFHPLAIGSESTETLRSAGHGACAELVLDAYQRYGESFIDQLRGNFALAVWDSRRQTLLLATDRGGLRPLYWTRTDSTLTFASTVRSLLVGKPASSVDRHGLCEFIVFGFPPGRRTLFDGIERITPGSLLTIEAGRARLRKYWHLSYEGAVSGSLSLIEATTRFTERFMAAVGQLADEAGPHGVPLSGGLDSRCILAALLAHGHDVKTFTMGSKDSADLRLGMQVARALGVSHESWVLTPRDFLSWVDDGIYLADGMASAFDTHILFLARRLSPDIRVVFDGTSSLDGMYSLVDVMLHRYFSRSYPDLRQVLWAFSKPLVGGDGALEDDGLFSYDLRTEAHRYACQTLEELLAEISPTETDPFDRIDLFEQTLRVPRYNMMGTALLRTHRDVRHPFHHPDVVDAVRRFPPMLRVREKPVQRRMLEQLAPELAPIPWERTGLVPSAGNGRILLHYSARLARRWAAGLTPAVLHRTKLRQGTAIDYGYWLTSVPEVQDFVRDTLLSKRCLQRGYFAPQVLRKLVNDQLSGRADHLSLLGRLLSTELAHRMFVDQPTRVQRVVVA